MVHVVQMTGRVGHKEVIHIGKENGMSDVNLEELGYSAKAAGLDITEVTDGVAYICGREWNPEVNDGDVFDLMSRLNIGIKKSNELVVAEVKMNFKSSDGDTISKPLFRSKDIPEGSDGKEELRLVIVELASACGRLAERLQNPSMGL